LIAGEPCQAKSGRYAFATGREGGQPMVFTVRPDTTGPNKPLRVSGPTAVGARVSTVNCSPTSNAIAFSIGDVTSLVSADGSRPRRLAGFYNPMWSADGSALTAPSASVPGVVAVLRPDGQLLGTVHCRCSAAALSASAGAVAYDRPDGGIYTARVDGSGGARIAISKTWKFRAPAWRPSPSAKETESKP
jgi:hypothetical protein